MDDPLPAIYTQFFREHPDSFDGVRLRARRPGRAPALAMNAATLKRFIVWADAQGYLRQRDAVPRLLSNITQWEHGEHRG